MNKYLFLPLIFFICIIIECSNGINSETNNDKDEKLDSSLIIVNQNDYIDIDDTSVKFLFRTNTENKVSLYISQDKNNLVELKSSISYNNKGIIIENLIPEKTYYYKIKVEKNGYINYSDVLSFQKLSNTNDWSHAEWAREAIFYEVFVRSFYDGNGDKKGDFSGLKEKIPYFNELGINALWLMPINSSDTYHGYDVRDYYNTEEDYGTLQEFEDFISEAHKNGIKIIIDLVINHSSDKNQWFLESQKTEKNNYTDYYIWETVFDDTTYWSTANNKKYYHNFSSDMPDLNFRNKLVRDDIKKVAKFWINKGIDGFRLDAARHIDDFDPDVTHNWWQEFNSYVKTISKDCFLVGENWITNDSEQMALYFKDLDSSFNFDIAGKIVSMAKGSFCNIITSIKDTHAKYKNSSENFIDCTFITNHDQSRVASEVNGNINKIKLAASLLLTLPGTPFIYYGEELGQLGETQHDNIREPFDWYKSAQGVGMTAMEGFFNPMKYTFPDDNISFEEQKNVEGSIFEYYKKLIEIRKSNRCFFYSENFQHIGDSKLYCAYKITGEGTNFFVINYLGEKSKELILKKETEELISGIKSSTFTLSNYNTLILKTTYSENEIFEAGQFDVEKFKHIFKYSSTDQEIDGVTLYSSDMTKDLTDDFIKMVKNETDDQFELELELETGEYKYNLALEKWVNDPNNSNTVSDGYGGYNNTFTITSLDGKKSQTFTFRPEDFGYASSQVQSISVAGDFNGWNSKSSPLFDSNIDGIYEITLNLDMGYLYGYKFVLNGTSWLTDKKNDMIWDDNVSGGYNSIIGIGGFDFEYNPDDNPDYVFPLGSFNNWNYNQFYWSSGWFDDFSKDGVFKTNLTFDTGTYQYKFLKIYMINDPYADFTNSNGESVIVIE